MTSAKTNLSLHAPDLARWQWRVRGQVQGVGFRPFVYRIAQQAGVTGRVFNDALGVHLEVQGSRGHLKRFSELFEREMPPLAKVESCARQEMAVIREERRFTIDQSASEMRRRSSPSAGEMGSATGGTWARVDAAVTVDTALCADCARELLAPDNRRHGHGLINCTNCGPRFSIVRDIPYDRSNTTMAGFAMCPACRREYEDPADRRFHAQPVCCPKCGPEVELMKVEAVRRRAPSLKGGGDGRRGKKKTDDVAPAIHFAVHHAGGDPFVKAAEMIAEGGIVAIKGIGGFHLAVRADWPKAVERLRALKERDAKPFALMCRDMEMACRLAALSPEAELAMLSVAAPIVLAPRRREADRHIADAVAPGTHLLGLMLPYTPIQHLLFGALERHFAKLGAPVPPLVMTSGNVSSEPLVTDNHEAVERLGPLCDAILWHDRPIERCVDDSVVLDLPKLGPVPIRRSRGFVPAAWAFPPELVAEEATGICLGGELKNTVAVVRGHDVIVSQHFGDLTHALAFEHFQRGVEDLLRLFHVPVKFVAHDLHPGYMSTVAARQLAERWGARLIPVQHHAAHAFGVLAEHGISWPALALVCDGTGYGTDGSIWGGEVLAIHGSEWKRLGRLRTMRLPGGDSAARDPRRSALSLLYAAYGEEFAHASGAMRLFPDAADRGMLVQMIRSGLNSPWTSSTGRLFDGVAALLGVCLTNEHEAQAAMALEAFAQRWAADGNPESAEGNDVEELYEVRWNEEEALWELDVRALIRFLVERRGDGVSAEPLAWLFHRKLAEGWVRLLQAAGGAHRLSRVPVGMSGGVFCNSLLAAMVSEAARSKAISTFFHKLYPMTDTGLAFGQAIFSRRLLLTRYAK